MSLLAKTLHRPATRGGVLDLSAMAAELFDGQVKPGRLLVEERAGARGAGRVHGKILDLDRPGARIVRR